jgi:DNA repair exonuclease SbcCD ATPase subunit
MKRRLLTLGLICAVVLSACNGNLSKEREKQLQDSFAAVMSNKDAELETLFQQLNEIDAKLGEVTKTYTDLAQVANNSGEVGKDAVSSIKNKIATINDILAADKEKLAAVNSRLARTQRQNKQLQTFVSNLEQRIKEQEEQIQTLTAELQKKNVQIDELTKNVKDLETKTKKKDQQIMQIEDEKHTAYFAIGTKKELRMKNLVDKRGGFIGLGKASVLADNTDFASLTKIDTRNTQEIPLTGKKIKIVTTHPDTSYSLEGDPDRPTSIRITNPDLFWKASKCLVIMVN